MADGGLRRDGAGPEHGQFTVVDAHSLAVVGLVQRLDTDRGRIADVNRCAMSKRVVRGDFRCFDGLHRGERPHRDHQGTFERSGGLAADAGSVHGDGFVFLEMAQRQARTLQRLLETERATEQKRDEIIAPPAEDVGGLVDQLAVFEDSVPRQIGTEVGAGRGLARFPGAAVKHFDDRAGTGIPLAEQQKVPGERLRNDDQVGLHEPHRETASGPIELAGSRAQASLTGSERGRRDLGHAGPPYRHDGAEGCMFALTALRRNPARARMRSSCPGPTSLGLALACLLASAEVPSVAHQDKGARRVEAATGPSSPATAANPYRTAARQIKELLYEHPKRHVQAMTSDGVPVNLMLHHGGAYSTRARARLEGRIRDGAILVLLDSHADLMDQVGLVPPPSTGQDADWIEYDIASHIVPSLADGLITEVIHLASRRIDRQGRLPGHLPSTRQLWIARVRDATGVEAALLLTGAKPTRLDAAARVRRVLQHRNKTLRALTAPTSTDVASEDWIDAVELVDIQSRPVMVRTTFADDLMVMPGGRRSVLLDIDEDFFVLGPHIVAREEKGEREMRGEARTVMERLSRAQLRPDLVSIALSPGFTPESDMVGVTAALLEHLDRSGLVRFRGAAADLKLTVNERWDDALPEVRAARAAVTAAFNGAGSVAEALAACDRVINAHGAAAVRQQWRGLAQSPFARGGTPEWAWQPSPVLVAQRELNGVGEAHALRAKLLNRVGRHREALDDLLAFDEHYPDAQQPVSIRQQSAGFGLIAAEGWQPRPASERRELLLETMAAVLSRSDPSAPDVGSVMRALEQARRAFRAQRNP
jgi:hypothetical protein